MDETERGMGRAEKTCNNKDHMHIWTVFLVMIIMLAVGGALGWVMNDGSGLGKPATMRVGKIYKVHAVVQLDKINWKERSEGLLVREEAQGTYPRFVEVPRGEVEGEIAVGKGIMRVEICVVPGCSPKVTRYKTGEIDALRVELEKLKGK